MPDTAGGLVNRKWVESVAEGRADALSVLAIVVASVFTQLSYSRRGIDGVVLHRIIGAEALCLQAREEAPLLIDRLNQ